MEETENKKKIQSRSPSFPTVTLEQAVRDIERIDGVYHSSWFNITDAASALGISPTSSKASRVMATLRNFGFVDRTGKGEYMVSEAAKGILYPDRPEERSEALRQAASHPTVFKQVFDRFPSSVPPMEAVVNHLKRGRFTDTAARLAAEMFVDTARFADLYADRPEGDETGPEPASSKNQEPENRSGPEQIGESSAREPDPSGEFSDWLVLPVGQRVTVRIQVKGQFNQAGLNHLTSVLKLQKHTLPSGTAESQSADSEDAQ